MALRKRQTKRKSLRLRRKTRKSVRGGVLPASRPIPIPNGWKLSRNKVLERRARILSEEKNNNNKKNTNNNNNNNNNTLPFNMNNNK